MFDMLFGASSDLISQRLSWMWANEHPYLYTAIKILQPSLLLVIIYVGLRIVQAIFSRR